jgi:hypothetical protein
MEVENPLRVLLFWKKVNKDGPISKLGTKCWIWTGSKDAKGYGNFTGGKRKSIKAHRFSFLLRWGWILSPPFYQVHHRCDNPSCVNPHHLMCISNTDNNALSNSPSAINKRKTHCKYGHAFDENNTRWDNGRRRCITCEKKRIARSVVC